MGSLNFLVPINWCRVMVCSDFITCSRELSWAAFGLLFFCLQEGSQLSIYPERERERNNLVVFALTRKITHLQTLCLEPCDALQLTPLINLFSNVARRGYIILTLAKYGKTVPQDHAGDNVCNLFIDFDSRINIHTFSNNHGMVAVICFHWLSDISPLGALSWLFIYFALILFLNQQQFHRMKRDYKTNAK